MASSGSCSRLIIKNLPKYYNDKKLRKLFENYDVTDVKLVHAEDGTFRRFAFVGLKSEESATHALNSLNHTYVDTLKIDIDYAAPIGKVTTKSIKIAKIGVEKSKRITIPELEIDEEDKDKFEEFLTLNHQKPQLSRATYTKKESHANRENRENPKIEKEIDESAFQSAQNQETIVDNARLFVRNLPYDCEEKDIRDLFSEFGQIDNVYVAVDKITGISKGLAYVTYAFPTDAITAMTSLDGHFLNGRVLHIIPAEAKPVAPTLPSRAGKNKNSKSLSNADSHPEWNSLFLGSKTTADILTSQLKITKHELLASDENENSMTPAVRLALGETGIVNETKSFLVEHGIQLEAFEKKNAVKSDDTILAKNLPAGTTEKELSAHVRSKLVFNEEGDVEISMPRIIMPPHGVTAILIFPTANDAKKAFRVLYFSKFKHVPFYLEWAPIDSYNKNIVKVKSSILPTDSTQTKTPNCVIYIKNLNFETSEKVVEQHFSSAGAIEKVVIAKTQSKTNGQLVSQGYGFVQYTTAEGAGNAIRSLQHSLIDGHRLILKMSNTRRIMNIMDSSKSTSLTSNPPQNVGEERFVILVKNLPFEAEQKEIEQLFGTFGNLKRVRLPKKLRSKENRHRGFAFVEFMTKEAAQSAFDALRFSTHLYGRRLVLEWASNTNSLEFLRKRAVTSTTDNRTYKQKKSILELNDE